MVDDKKLKSIVEKVMMLIFDGLNPQIIHEYIDSGRIDTAIALVVAKGFVAGLKEEDIYPPPIKKKIKELIELISKLEDAFSAY